jgi:hypothetical protein
MPVDYVINAPAANKIDISKIIKINKPTILVTDPTKSNAITVKTTI